MIGKIKLKCLREYKIDMCGNCDYYNPETGECDATPKQIGKINKELYKK